jgi:hypothetical protein
LVSGVESFDGGKSSFHVTGAVNETGGNTVVRYTYFALFIQRWSNGLPLVVVLDEHPAVERGRVVSINFLPVPKIGPEDAESEFWGNFIRY